MAADGWHEFIKADAQLTMGVPSQIDRVVTFGGVPITVDGRVIGGIGVCSGHWRDDAAIACAGRWLPW